MSHWLSYHFPTWNSLEKEQVVDIPWRWVGRTWWDVEESSAWELSTWKFTEDIGIPEPGRVVWSGDVDLGMVGFWVHGITHGGMWNESLVRRRGGGMFMGQHSLPWSKRYLTTSFLMKTYVGQTLGLSFNALPSTPIFWAQLPWSQASVSGWRLSHLPFPFAPLSHGSPTEPAAGMWREHLEQKSLSTSYVQWWAVIWSLWACRVEITV